MSAICGWLKPGAPPDARALDAMAARAPGESYDWEGRWQGDGVALAHSALYVTAEDVRERQPVRHPTRPLTLVADLRIDNRDALLHLLQGDPRVSPEATDADLVLAGYARWGTACPERLLGDFSLALWDGENGQLFAARDPLGLRPFYYSECEGGLSFGSSIAQVLKAFERQPRINELAVAAHITGSPPFLDQSFYEGVHQLRPAHALVATPGNPVKTWRYWDIDFGTRVRYSDERDYEAHFLELFEKAVEARLRTAFPIGILLSGGHDSGSAASVAGLVRERSGAGASVPIHAVSFAFDDFPEADERHVSDRIVERFGFSPHYVHTREAWPLKDYPRYAPPADTPLIGAYHAVDAVAFGLMQSLGVRSLIDGHRGDLVAGGYILDYPTLFWAGRWQTLVRDLDQMGRLYGEGMRDTLRRAFWLSIRRSLWPEGRAEGLRLRLRRLRSGSPPAPEWVRASWLHDVGLAEAVAEAVEPLPWGVPYARQRRYRSVFTPLHAEVPLTLWRAQAPFGITRSDPWSDRRLVEFAVAVPQEILNRPTEPKRLVRRSIRGIMPEAAWRAAGKYYPEPLFLHALRDAERTTVLNLLTDMAAARAGFVDEEPLQASYEAFRRGAPEPPLLWSALTLEMWLRAHWT